MDDAEVLAEVTACAWGALSWLDGYTDPFPDGLQRRAQKVGGSAEDEVWEFTPQDGTRLYTTDHPRRFRIKLVVEEVT